MSLDAASTGTRGLSDVAPRDAAVFLDFDGVLVEIAPAPGAVRVSEGLTALLAALEAGTGGACAIVTGRPVEDLRRHLPEVPRAVFGSHGAERLLPGVDMARHALIGSDKVARLHREAARAEAVTGVLVERKPTGVALHFRAAPEAEAQVRDFARALEIAFDGFETLEAKAAIELRPAGIGKGAAVEGAMSEPPFAGRVPVCFGDDTTDEPALAWVAGQGGVAVKVGPGETVAPRRLAGPAEVRAALSDWLATGGAAR